MDTVGCCYNCGKGSMRNGVVYCGLHLVQCKVDNVCSEYTRYTVPSDVAKLRHLLQVRIESGDLLDRRDYVIDGDILYIPTRQLIGICADARMNWDVVRAMLRRCRGAVINGKKWFGVTGKQVRCTGIPLD